MIIGYARVSTQNQNLDLQIDALEKEGCEKIYSEKITGKIKQRPELEKMLEHARNGDVIVVWKLSRLGRSSKHLISIVSDLNERQINLLSVKDGIDTSIPIGRYFFTMIAAFVEFERENIQEGTLAGLEAARARGRIGGQPKGLSDKAKLKARYAASLYKKTDPKYNQII